MAEKTQYIIEKFTISSKLQFKKTNTMDAKTIYPCIEDKKALGAKEINEFYQLNALNHQKYVNEQILTPAVEDYILALKSEIPPYQWISEYMVTYNKAPILSLNTRNYQYTSGAHGLTMMTSQTWNVETGKRIELKDFFPSGDDYKKLIRSEIIRQIKAQIAQGKDYYFSNYKELVEEKFNAESFYLTQKPNAIVFYFQQYDIAPYASGILNFSLPLENDKA